MRGFSNLLGPEIMRRNFTRKEKIAMYLLQDGKCAICGEELVAGLHGDHVTAFVKGGLTDVINGQGLCVKCNLKKGGE